MLKAKQVIESMLNESSSKAVAFLKKLEDEESKRLWSIVLNHFDSETMHGLGPAIKKALDTLTGTRKSKLENICNTFAHQNKASMR